MAATILIVDDDRALVESLQTLLIMNKFNTAVAYGALAVPELLSKLKPDLILLDLQMADGDGQSCIDFVRNMLGDNDIKIIVTSGLDIGRLKEAVESGANDLLQKPFSSDALLAKIKEVLG